MRRRWIAALGALMLASTVWALLAGAKVVHIAVPVLGDGPEGSVAPGAPIDKGPAWPATPLCSIGGRVSALACAPDGDVWIGSFDRGLYRCTRSGDSFVLSPWPPSPPLEGRERFVTAVQMLGPSVVVGTYAGLVVLDGRSGRSARVGERALVEALQPLGDGRMVVGGARGLFVLARAREPGRFSTVRSVEQTPEGPLRVTALALSEERVWIGSARGVFSLPRAQLEDPARALRWHPLVFGPRAASTNAVVALAPDEGGVVAGTDTGGIARVLLGETFALRFDEPRANLVNPGALLVHRPGVLVGTQGGGLLWVVPSESRAARPMGVASAAPTALAACDDGRVVVGDDTGRVIVMAPVRRPFPNAPPAARAPMP